MPIIKKAYKPFYELQSYYENREWAEVFSILQNIVEYQYRELLTAYLLERVST